MPTELTPDESVLLEVFARASRSEEGRPDELVTVLYADLRLLARRILRDGDRNATLSPTGLLHEVYLSKLKRLPGKVADPGHFVAVVARGMRQVLIERARSRRSRQRLEQAWAVSTPPESLSPTLQIALHRELDRLRALDSKAAAVFDLRYFLQCTQRESAVALKLSDREARDRWEFSRAWMAVRLGDRPV